MSFKSRAFASALRHTIGRRRSRGSSFITPISPASAALKLARRLVGPPPSKVAGKRPKANPANDTPAAEVGHGLPAYCLTCRAMRDMSNPSHVTMKNGQLATRGICPVCGTQMYRVKP